MASRRSHAPTNASKWNNSRLGYAMGGCGATARRHSLLCLHWLLITGCLLPITLYHHLETTSSKVPQSGTYHQKPTASCEAAQLWVRTTTPTTIVPRSGTDISTMILRTIHRSRFAEPRECEEVCLPTAALLRSLQWVSDRYVSPRDTAPLILSYSNRGRQPPKHRTTKEPQAAGQT